MINITDDKYKKSYKELSYDDANKEYLIDIDDKFAIDFDDVATDFGKMYNVKELKSCDALIYDKEKGKSKYKFIEFKNGKFKEADIRYKIYFSIFMLSVIENKKVSEMEIEFELVYNPLAMFTVNKKDNEDTVEVQVSIKRRTKKILREIQPHSDDIQKSMHGYNANHADKNNGIVKTNRIDKKGFEKRERQIT